MIPRNAAVRASWLALVAGLSDGLGWLQTGLFAAQMTGNTALLGVAIAARDWHGAGQKAAAIGCFIAGTLVAQLLLRPERGPRRGKVPAVLLASLVIVVAAFLPKPANVLVLGAALGAQNAAFSSFDGQNINTSFISGDLQKFAFALAGRIAGRARAKGDQVLLVAVPSLWLAYVAGAALGVLCQHNFRLPLLVPAALLPLALFMPRDDTEASGRPRPAREESAPARSVWFWASTLLLLLAAGLVGAVVVRQVLRAVTGQ